MEVIEGFGISDWGFQENEQGNIEGLKDRLFYTTRELEAVRAKSEEDIRKNEEHTKQLLELLQLTIKQRDEARDQLRKLLSNLFPIDDSSPLTSTYQPDNPLAMSTESVQYNPSSSPMILYPEHVSSFDPSSINFVDSGGINQLPFASSGPGGLVKCDMADMVIEHLVANKPLPEKGKLSQTIMQTGPLLKKLLVAGPLPRWRNLPPLQPIKGGVCDGRILNSNLTGRVNFDGFNSGSTMNFAGPNSGLLLCQRKRPPLLSSSCDGNHQNYGGKRLKSR